MEQNDHHKFCCNLASFKIVYYMSKINTCNSSYNHPTQSSYIRKTIKKKTNNQRMKRKTSNVLDRSLKFVGTT